VESTNDKIIDLIKQRLNQGNAKFGREMPIGKYKEMDVLEEVLDTSIYTASLILELIEMEEKNNANSKDQRTYLET
tara:strand:- start:1561 stop:1788 length:228 start_codon:yes stop_codon:yes gene_type:complete